jgi:hypothetical protein
VPFHLSRVQGGKKVERRLLICGRVRTRHHDQDLPRRHALILIEDRGRRVRGSLKVTSRTRRNRMSSSRIIVHASRMALGLYAVGAIALATPNLPSLFAGTTSACETNSQKWCIWAWNNGSSSSVGSAQGKQCKGQPEGGICKTCQSFPNFSCTARVEVDSYEPHPPDPEHEDPWCDEGDELIEGTCRVFDQAHVDNVIYNPI